MKINYITIIVRDIEKSLAFYKELVELKVARHFHPGSFDIAFLENEAGETMVELVQPESGETVSASGIIISFSSKNRLNTVWEKAKAMGYTPTKIFDEGPKPNYFHVTDPDGVTVEFTI